MRIKSNGVLSLALLMLAIPLVLIALTLGKAILLIRSLGKWLKLENGKEESRPEHKAQACDTCTPHGHA